MADIGAVVKEGEDHLIAYACGWQTIRQTTTSGGVTIHLLAPRKTERCPRDMKRRTSVHSRR